MGYHFMKFRLKIKKDLQKRANQRRFRKLKYGKNGGLIWKN